MRFLNHLIFFAGFASLSAFLRHTTFARFRSVQLRAEQDETPNRHYHYSKKYYEEALQRLHENNLTSRIPPSSRDPRLNFRRQGESSDAFRAFIDGNDTIHADDLPGITIILKGGFFQPYGDEDGDEFQEGEDAEDHQEDDDDEPEIREGFNPFMPRYQQKPSESKNGPHRRENPYRRAFRQGLEDSEKKEKLKSKNFEVIKNYDVKFSDVGGYEKIKDELRQSVDLLRNYHKYAKYNVRIPKGLILEGPPGNGKTLLAKSLAGEAGCGFIAVSGADFQEKYVGVGSSRIREMFELAKKNEPCIVFIDEIDAVGRHRSGDGESSSSERDNI